MKEMCSKCNRLYKARRYSQRCLYCNARNTQSTTTTALDTSDTPIVISDSIDTTSGNPFSSDAYDGGGGDFGGGGASGDW